MDALPAVQTPALGMTYVFSAGCVWRLAPKSPDLT
jgi:hypothetical protein